MGIRATGPDLWVTACLDGRVIKDWSPADTAETLICEFDDIDDQRHEFTLCLRGKQPSHTRLNEQGTIVEDRLILIEDVSIDDIDISYDIRNKFMRYEHDFNGTRPKIVDKFHGVMGCNGTMTLEFTTPVYLWLLENM